MTSKNAPLAAVFAAALVSSAAVADTYVLTNDGASEVYAFSVAAVADKGKWVSETTGEDATSKPCAGNDYAVPNGMTLAVNATATFGGDSLTLRSGGVLCFRSGSIVTVNDFISDGGHIFINNEVGYDQPPYLAGNVSVTANGLHLRVNRRTRPVGISAAISGPADSFVRAYTLTSSDSTRYPDNKTFVTGDCSAFLGRFIVSPATEGTYYYGTVVLTHANALAGNSGVATPDKIDINKGRLYISAAAAAGADPLNGITVTGTGTGYCSANRLYAANAGEDVVLGMPITGAGSIHKYGTETIRLTGNVDLAGGIIVEEGTLEIDPADGKTFDASVPVTVKSGASIAYPPSLALSNLVLEEGSSRSWLRMTIPFDGTNAVKQTLPQDFDFEGNVQPFALSQNFDFPFSATSRVAVLDIPGGGATLELFRDETMKTYDLPMTWLELEENPLGGQTLFVVARPVVMPGKGSFDLSQNDSWSDEKPAGPGKDAYADGSIGNVRTSSGGNTDRFRFPGETLTVIGTCKIFDYTTLAEFNEVRFYNGAYLNIKNAGSGDPRPVRKRTVTGEFYIDTSCAGNEASQVRIDGNVSEVDCAFNLSGEGALTFSTIGGSACTNAINPETATIIKLSGDSSEYRGKLTFIANNNVADYIRIRADSAAAFGGPLDVLDASAVQMTVYLSGSGYKQPDRVIFEPTSSFTIDAANRGWYIYYGSICTPEDVTLTFRPAKFTLINIMEKLGGGTLAVGTTVTVSGNGDFNVKEGWVTQLKSGAFADVNMKFFEGAGIRVDATAPNTVKAKGLAPKVFALDAGVTELPVAFANLVEAAGSGEITLAICTVPEETADLSGILKVRGGGWRAVGGIAKATADGFTTYSVTVRRAGTMLMLK